MKRRIKRIAPLQAGKMLGALYACMGLIFLPFFALAAAAGAFAPSSQQSAGAPPPALFAGMMFGFGICMPIIHGVIGFRWRNCCRCDLQPFSCGGLAVSRSKSNNCFSTADEDNRQILRQIPSEMSI
jgi:hypothetical protein